LQHGHGLLSDILHSEYAQKHGKTWEHDWEESNKNVRSNIACTRAFPHLGQLYIANGAVPQHEVLGMDNVFKLAGKRNHT